MADISAEIAAFKNAIYGEDVRDSMVSLANKINSESSSAEEIVGGYNERLAVLEADGAITTNRLATESVTDDKLSSNGLKKNYTDFKDSLLTQSPNIAPFSSFEPYTNLNNSGAFSTASSNTNTVASDKYIPVSAGKNYKISFVGVSYPVAVSYCVYDENKSFISSIMSYTKIPEGGAYIRVKLNSSGNSLDMATNITKIQIEEGTTAHSYREHEVVRSEKLEYINPDDTTFFDESEKIKWDHIPEITIDKTEFAEPSKNLIPNGSTFKPFTNLNNNSGAFSTASSNTNTVALDYFIPVEQGKQYIFSADPTYTNGAYISYFRYSETYEFLGYDGVKPHVPIEDESFVRIKLNWSGKSEWMANAAWLQFEEGQYPTDYKDSYVLKKTNLPIIDPEDTSLIDENGKIKENLLPNSIENFTSVRMDALSDANLKSISISKQFASDVINETINPRYELRQGFNEVIRRHMAKRPNSILFSFITDCHIGGTRSPEYDPSTNITEFINRSNAFCDFAVNGGDLITNYYDEQKMSGLSAALTTEEQAHDAFAGLTVPYYIAKGNHDIGINGFSEITAPSSYADGYYGIDPATGATFMITESIFDEYVASGNAFYTLSGYEYFTNQEIQEVALDGYCDGAVFNPSDQYGWYYYKDFDNRLRLIVLNDFYNINDSGGSGIQSRSPYEETWLQGVLSSALASNLAVLTVSHTASGINNPSIKTLFTSFVGDGGTYIGHIHGHEHHDVYTCSPFNNIGENDSIIKSSLISSYDGFSFSIFEVDILNKLLYETRFGKFDDYGSDAHGVAQYRSEDRVFSFDSHMQIV